MKITIKTKDKDYTFEDSWYNPFNTFDFINILKIIENDGSKGKDWENYEVLKGGK
jgi:hypothetical protein